MFQRARWSMRARLLPYKKVRVETSRGEFALDTQRWQVAPLVAQYGKGEELAYEKEESERFLGLIKEGDIVFDIGAQVGYYTLLAFHGGAKKVYAFEISKAYAKEVQRQSRLLGAEGRVEVLQAALGEKDGAPVVFQDYFGKTKMSGMALDTFCKEKNIWPDVIKMDVQGSEVIILKGMKEVMRTGKPKMMVMLYDTLLRKQGETKEEGLQIIRECGYNVEQFANDASYICLPKK